MVFYIFFTLRRHPAAAPTYPLQNALIQLIPWSKNPNNSFAIWETRATRGEGRTAYQTRGEKHLRGAVLSWCHLWRCPSLPWSWQVHHWKSRQPSPRVRSHIHLHRLGYLKHQNRNCRNSSAQCAIIFGCGHVLRFSQVSKTINSKIGIQKEPALCLISDSVHRQHTTTPQDFLATVQIPGSASKVTKFLFALSISEKTCRNASTCPSFY